MSERSGPWPWVSKLGFCHSSVGLEWEYPSNDQFMSCVDSYSLQGNTKGKLRVVLTWISTLSRARSHVSINQHVSVSVGQWSRVASSSGNWFAVRVWMMLHYGSVILIRQSRSETHEQYKPNKAAGGVAKWNCVGCINLMMDWKRVQWTKCLYGNNHVNLNSYHIRIFTVGCWIIIF